MQSIIIQACAQGLLRPRAAGHAPRLRVAAGDRPTGRIYDTAGTARLKGDTVNIEILKKQELDDGHIMVVRTRLSEEDKNALVNEAIEEIGHNLGISADEVPDLREAVLERTGHEQLRQLVTTYAAQMAAPSVINELGIKTMFAPEVDTSSVDDIFDKGPIVLPIQFTIKPSFELDSYGPLEVTMPAVEVTDDMVSTQIGQILEQVASYERADEGALAAGDRILCDIVTTQDGAMLDAVTGENHHISLERGAMPDEFIDQLVGAKVGDTREFDFSAPDPTGASGTQKVPGFHTSVTVRERYARNVPELTDELVQKQFKGKDVADFRAMVKKTMEEDLAKQWEKERDNLVDQALSRRLVGKIPDMYYEKNRDDIIANMSAQLASQGMNLQQYMQQQGMDERSFGMQLMMQAMSSLRQGFALDALYAHLGLELTDEDMDRALKEMAPGHEDEVRANFDHNGAWFVLREMAERMKAHDWAMAHTTFLS